MFQTKGGLFIFELDEKQHFNSYRSKTLSLYPKNLLFEFSIELWVKICNKKSILKVEDLHYQDNLCFPMRTAVIVNVRFVIH